MSFYTILETMLIGPLKLVFEFIFAIANRFIGHPGLAIIVLSLTMNILVLPLYKRADAKQEEARDIDARLHKGVTHIKKTFSGDERMMILQTYYRQNNYSPLSALNGSVSLLLEIPFFMAAYQFLSHLEILNGVSLGPISDLGAPDGLIIWGDLSVNLLPILMTLVNFVSSTIYLKGFPLKTKIQLYGMALFFLVFLYNSPSCLVFYWTLNNVFSLVKTIFYKIPNPRKVLKVLGTVSGAFLLGFAVFVYKGSFKFRVFLIVFSFAMLLPSLLSLLKHSIHFSKIDTNPNRAQFILCGVFLSILLGLLIPSAFIAASPHEYVDMFYFHNPLWYLVTSFCLASGFFLVWMGVFYWLANHTGKAIFDRIIWILCGVTLVNYMFFGTDLGVISSTLQYEKSVSFSFSSQLINIVILILVIAILYFLACKYPRTVSTMLLTSIIALGGMSAINIVRISNSVADMTSKLTSQENDIPSFQLSKTGKNVVVLMLDRAMGEYIPYIFNEKPELAEQYSGFIYYPNTISFGAFTNFGVPALFGGYEYTPVEMNKRDSEPLVVKHNEAVKLMPVLFSENGFDVTVCDPTYANYKWNPGLSVFDDYPSIRSYLTKGRFSDVTVKERLVQDTHRNFFWLSLMKVSPLFLQPTIYNEGGYNQSDSGSNQESYSNQVLENDTIASGLSSMFMNPFNVLRSLSKMTKVTKDSRNTYLFLANDSTHEPTLLQLPDYVPSMNVDNTIYEENEQTRVSADGKILKMDTTAQITHYHANMAVMLQLGKWFDYLRKHDVYDNTRIIIASDHGKDLKHFDELILNDTSPFGNVEYFYPLLMVKDFNSTGFTTSNQFMTNADVPLLAIDKLIDNPHNPFTGKALNNDEKYAHEQFIIMSSIWDISKNAGNTFAPAAWASVKDNLWEAENWNFYEGEYILKTHNAPR